MSKQYGFSLDGTNWRGRFSTRKEARVAGMRSAERLAEVPGVIFVARVRAMEMQACGHGPGLIREMNRRHRDGTGDSTYLSNVTDEHRNELDSLVEQAIAGWVTAHDLQPDGQRVEAISEYPLPPAPKHEASDTFEVSDHGMVSV